MFDEEIHTLFENWFKVHYDWYIKKARRGYSLARDSDGKYQWDIPAHDFEVFTAALKIGRMF
jgi:hypothetical protein